MVCIVHDVIMVELILIMSILHELEAGQVN
jgi:hypothetical protein